MLNCAAGMSTSLLASRMQKAAQKQNIDAQIFAAPASEADDKIANGDIDCVLLGPQIAYMKDEFVKKTAGKGKDHGDIPLAIISMSDYGMMDGEKVLAQAEKLIKGE